MGCLYQDLRFGLRMLRRSPGFTAVAVATIALGIGATSTVFSVVQGVLLKPLPYPEPARLVRVYSSNPAAGFPVFPMSPADFLDYRDRSQVFEDFAGFVRNDKQYGGERPERLIGMRVSYGFFRLLGIQPMLGRAFRRTEDANEPVVILSYRAWQRLFHGDPHVIGGKIELTDSLWTIVGVMPPGFQHPGGGYPSVPHGDSVDVWSPLNLPRDRQRVDRGGHWYSVIGRLKPGITVERAHAEMNLVARRLETQYGDDRGWRILVEPLLNDVVGKARPLLLVLAGAVAFVLLIACVNVANLLLARATVREREIAVRAALGAGRRRLVRQMLTESLALAALGGALGMSLAMWGVRALVLFAPQQVPRLHAIRADSTVLLFTMGAALATGLLFGLAPAWHASKANLSESLKEGAQAASSGRRHNRLRSSFVIAEIALAFVLLIGAGLLLRTFVALARVEPGFNPRGVLTFNTSLSFPKLVGARRYTVFYERFLEKLARLPGVSFAGAASALPWTPRDSVLRFDIEGRPPSGLAMHANADTVSPDWFRAMGVPLVAGRWFTTADHFDAPKVVMVNRALALRYWPTVEACLGRQISTFDYPMTIIGIAGDVKDSPADAQAQPAIYLPLLQRPWFGTFVALRATGDTAALIPAVRRVAAEMGNDLSIQDIRPMAQVTAAAMASQRFALQTIGLFAAVALLLALIGIYGVMSYAAGRRAHEIAIRMALGAAPRDTIRLLLGEGLRLIAAGILVGVVAAAGLTRALSGILYGVGATDPLTFGAVAALLAAVATAACLMPAWRALQIDPLAWLRHE